MTTNPGDSRSPAEQAEWLAANRAAWNEATTPEYRRYMGEEGAILDDLYLKIDQIPKFHGLPEGSKLPVVRLLCAKGHLIFKAHAWITYPGNTHRYGREVPALEFVVDEMAASAGGASTISDSTPYISEAWIEDLAKTDDELGEYRSIIHCSLCPRSRIAVRQSSMFRRYMEAVILGKKSVKVEGDTQR